MIRKPLADTEARLDLLEDELGAPARQAPDGRGVPRGDRERDGRIQALLWDVGDGQTGSGTCPRKGRAAADGEHGRRPSTLARVRVACGHVGAGDPLRRVGHASEVDRLKAESIACVPL